MDSFYEIRERQSAGPMPRALSDGPEKPRCRNSDSSAGSRAEPRGLDAGGEFFNVLEIAKCFIATSGVSAGRVGIYEETRARIVLMR